jgi:hypothetical protein
MNIYQKQKGSSNKDQLFFVVNLSSPTNCKVCPSIDYTSSGKFSNEVLQIFHQNIQVLRTKTDEISNFLYPELRKVLCLTEHHLDLIELGADHMDGYIMGTSYCRRFLHKGGSCIYVQDT